MQIIAALPTYILNFDLKSHNQCTVNYTKLISVICYYYDLSYPYLC